ncbi:DNA double-strand break repair nuclease NurA [Methanosphaera sp.]
MLEPLYGKTIERKKEITTFFNELQNSIDTDKIRKDYTEYTFTKDKQDKIFAAIDGSFNRTKFMAYFVYAIDSQTILSHPTEGMMKESSTGDINIISTIRSRNMDSLLSQHMNILELKSTIDTLQKHEDIDYMLMDGSIRGTLMNFKTNYELDPRITRTLQYYSRELENSIKNKDFPLEVTTITKKSEILLEVRKVIEDEKLDIDIDEIEFDVLRYFEGLEQLTCITHLLKYYKDKIICVSKTSSTKDFFNEKIPDAAAIEYSCEKPGISQLVTKSNNKMVRYDDVGRKFLIEYPINSSELTDITYTIFFTRLDNRSNVLKIELPRTITQNEVIQLLEEVYSTCIEGYPYILKKAHNEVLITNEDMKNIVRKLEIFEKTGRDMLN